MISESVKKIDSVLFPVIPADALHRMGYKAEAGIV
jgi:hypothetical protein